MNPELLTPVWRFTNWWDDAIALARDEAKRTGRRYRVAKSLLFPRMWVVLEVGA